MQAVYTLANLLLILAEEGRYELVFGFSALPRLSPTICFIIFLLRTTSNNQLFLVLYVLIIYIMHLLQIYGTSLCDLLSCGLSTRFRGCNWKRSPRDLLGCRFSVTVGSNLLNIDQASSVHVVLWSTGCKQAYSGGRGIV